jgi:hypothetical protein
MKRLWLIFISILLLCGNVYAVTTVIKIIDPDNGAGTDYTSLSAWEAAQQGDLTGARNEIAIAKCRSTGGTADTASLVISGWTTSSTQYIKIWTDPTETYRHNGTWQTGNKYKLEITGSSSNIFLYNSNIFLDGLQIKSINPGQTYAAIEVEANYSYITISNCVILGAATSDTFNGILQLSTGTVNIFNTIVVDLGSNGSSNPIYLNAAGVMNLYNSTVLGTLSGNGIHQASSGTLTAKNCYSRGYPGYAYYGTITKTTCASSDTTGSIGLQNIAYSTANFTNVTAGSEDFHLPLGSALIKVGTNTSGESAPLNFTTDIDGQNRKNTWDIGADEYRRIIVRKGRIIPGL